MNVLITSDTHGILDGIDPTGMDAVVFAGDIAPLKGRGPWHIYDQVKWMNKRFSAWCQKWPDVKFVIVPGNHDFFPLAREIFDRAHISKSAKIELPENACMLIDRGIDIASKNGDPADHIRIYGSPWVPIISHTWAFEAEHDQLKEKFSLIPKGVDLLVTHAPPHIGIDFPIDVSLQWGGTKPFGSTELAEEIFSKEPRVAVFGHIHSGLHKKVTFGKTDCYNVSRVDERYEVAYDPLTLKL